MLIPVVVVSFFVFEVHLSTLSTPPISFSPFLHHSPFLLSNLSPPPYLPPSFGLHIQITSLDTDPSIPPNLSKMSILFLLGCRAYMCNTHIHTHTVPCTGTSQAGKQSAYEISPWEYLIVKKPIHTHTLLTHTRTHARMLRLHSLSLEWAFISFLMTKAIWLSFKTLRPASS